MKVRLELVHKKAKVKKVWLKGDTVIGRSTECGLRVASNEVSRQHCKISLSEEGVTVRDLGSSNGTFVNGYQLEPDTDYEIAPDSELSLGGIKFFVRFKEPARPAPANGMGSTVDLKPGIHPVPEQTRITVRKSDPETEPAPSSEPAVDIEQDALPLVSDEATAETVRPMASAEAEEDEDEEIRLSTHGDSAILVKGNDNLADMINSAAPPAKDGIEQPETKEVPNNLLMEEVNRALNRESLDDDDTSHALGGIAEEPTGEEPLQEVEEQDVEEENAEQPAEEDAAEFLNQAAEEEPPEEAVDDESLGDFFKQFE